MTAVGRRPGHPGLLRLLVPLLALPQLTHYILDAYVWRLDGTNPGLSTALLIPVSAPPTTPAAVSDPPT